MIRLGEPGGDEEEVDNGNWFGVEENAEKTKGSVNFRIFRRPRKSQDRIARAPLATAGGKYARYWYRSRMLDTTCERQLVEIAGLARWARGRVFSFS